MSHRHHERIAALEAYEREQRRPAEATDELDEGMCELARLLGLPDTREGLNAHFRREKLRRRLWRFGLPVVVFLLLAAAAWLLFRLLT